MGGIETIRIWVSYFFTDIEVVCDALQTYIYIYTLKLKNHEKSQV